MAGKKRSTEKDKMSLKILDKLMRADKPKSIYWIQQQANIRDYRTVLRKVNRLVSEGLMKTVGEEGGRQARLSSITQEGLDLLFITHTINENEYSLAKSYFLVRKYGFPKDKKMRKTYEKFVRRTLHGTLRFDMATWIAWTKDALRQKEQIKVCEAWMKVFEDALDDDTLAPGVKQVYKNHLKEGKDERAKRKKQLNDRLAMMRKELKNIEQL